MFNKELLKDLKGVKYVHLNVRSLLPKFQLLEEDLLDGSFDVICLTETWLKKGIPDCLICNQNYNLIRHDRTTLSPVTDLCKTGGGIVVYLRKGIVYEICELLCTGDLELCITKLSINNNKKQVLFTVYRPPGGNSERALDILSGFCDKYHDKYNNTELLILGDLNINYLDKRCKQVKLLKSLEKQFGLTQTIETATRVTLQKGTLIDLCLTNMRNISHSGTVCYFLSDHFPIFVIKKKLKTEKKSCNFYGRSYLNYSLQAHERELRLIDWTNFKMEPNPDILWNTIQQILLDVSNTLCPIRKFNITRVRPVYFTNELVEMIKERDTLLRLATHKKDTSYWKRGTKLRKDIVGFIKEAKREYIVNKLQTHRNNSKKYWQAVQLVLPNARSAGIEVIFDPAANKIVSGVLAANAINNYFAKIGETLAKKLPMSETEFWPNPVSTKFVWDHNITAFDILYHSKDFCKSKSSGINGISSTLLLDFFHFKTRSNG